MVILGCWRVDREVGIGRKRDWRRIGIMEILYEYIEGGLFLKCVGM